MAITVLQENPRFVVEDSRGYQIIKPASMAGDVWQHPFNRHINSVYKHSHQVKHVPGVGTFVFRDDETHVVLWPSYGSGWDDIFSRALVGGYIGNVNASPVVDTYLSTVVAKIQSMVRTWVNRVRGRRSPVKRTLDLMARADDSQFGSAEFVGNFMGALCTDNRGAIGAQVPFAYIDFDKWGEFGMEVEEIEDWDANGRKRQHGEDYYVLRMEQDAFRENQGLWTVDGMTCYPTGIPEYPYWFRTYSKERKRIAWVLIHRDFGWQVLAQAGPRDGKYPGFGQSGAWRYSPYVAKGIAVDTMDWEHLISQPMRGIVWATGLDHPSQFADQLRAFQQDKEDDELRFYPGVFFGGSANENAQITMLPWSEPPAGYTPDAWAREKIDALAASFHMSSTQLQVRLGEGALTQSDVASAMEAETAIAWWRHAVEMLWNYVAPPRITVTVIWPSDRNKRIMVETFREMSLGVQRVNRPDLMGEEEPVFSRDDIRLLTKEFVGIPLPDTSDDEISVEDRHSGTDLSAQRAQLISPSSPLSKASPDELRAIAHVLPTLKDAVAHFVVGDVVLLRETGEAAQVTRPTGSEWVWVRTQSNYEMLLRDTSLALLPQEVVKGSEHDGHDHDVDRYEHPFFRAPRAVKQIDAFQPEGDPLPFPEEVDIDWDEAIAAAHILWGEFAPEFLEGNWVWDEEEVAWVNEDTGETMTQEEMVRVRDAIADGTDEAYTTWPPPEDEEEPETEEDTSNLVWLLFLGLLTLGEWERRMRTRIADAIVSQWLFAMGDAENMTSTDRARIEALVLEQWQFLNSFSQTIAEGAMSREQIANRAGLYFSDTIRAFEEGRAAGFSYDLELPAHPGDCSSECCARDRCYLAYTDTGETLEIRWVRTASESCPTCIRRSLCAALIFDRLTGELEGGDCWLE